MQIIELNEGLSESKRSDWTGMELVGGTGLPRQLITACREGPGLEGLRPPENA